MITASHVSINRSDVSSDVQQLTQKIDTYELLLSGVAKATNQLLTSHNYDHAVNSALATLGQATQVDRAYIFEMHAHQATQAPLVSQKWEWVAPGIHPEIDNPELQNFPFKEAFPRWYQAFMNNLPIFGLVHTFPKDEREILESQHILSIVVVPITIHDNLWGFIGFDDCRQQRTWTTIEISTLWAIAGSFGGTLAQHHAETSLQQLNQFLEKRIASRTQALLQANQEIASTLHQLQQTQSQLIQAEKMSSLGQLVAGIAHEINNPISFIHGNLHHVTDYFRDLICLVETYQQENFEPSEHLQQQLKKIDFDLIQHDSTNLLQSMKKGTQRITNIVKSLRTFSRLDESVCKRVDIHDGIESALMMLCHRLKDRNTYPAIKLIKRYGQLPLVRCFPSALNQAVMSILVNAIDALDGAFGNTLTGHPLPVLEIETLMISPKTAQIRILDNGLVSCMDYGARIFDPFFTTKPVGRGTGMGLATSHQIIVNQHRGRLDHYRTDDEKTVFVIEIPVNCHDHSATL